MMVSARFSIGLSYGRKVVLSYQFLDVYTLFIQRMPATCYLHVREPSAVRATIE